MTKDEVYMNLCLTLAMLGKGNVAPNPMVGCVIVCEGRIIGEGYHELFGGPHAEVNAIRSVRDKSLLKKSTLYVNLEPCSHWGKTPPCSNLIVEHAIPKVIIGSIDSHSKVAGQGIEHLRKAGVTVEVGVIEQECITLNRRFYIFHEKERPFVLLKWAETKDGFIDIAQHLKTTQKGLWITNDECRKLVHKWRSEETAIMVGTNTAKIDNPSLTTREWTGQNPIRVSIDKELSFPENLHLLDNSVRTIIFTHKQKENLSNIEYITQAEISVTSILAALHARDIQSILIEGGTKLLQSFIDADAWDEARVFIGNRYFEEGVRAPKLTATLYESEMIGDSTLRYYRNK
jgi:diaminohydroxyphosphoribosylaminopyrimidine deaminase / 5-amino-6-(5-phosphoribosylamino)uracil reductase